MIEENAIYSVACIQAMFNIRKILYRYIRKDDARSESFVATLISMLGDHYNNVEELNSCIKTWTRIADRGGLKHVTLDAFCFF